MKEWDLLLEILKKVTLTLILTLNTMCITFKTLNNVWIKLKIALIAVNR
jgi:hypothetical protein